MIAIREAGEAEAARLTAAAGITHPVVCLVLEDGGRICGQAFYRRTGEAMELLAVTAPGPAETEGLIRAALHAAQGAGARVACSGTAALFPLLERLGFHSEDRGMTVDIGAFFARPCRGGRG